MENPEVPLEQVHEHIQEHAHMSKEGWISAVAVSTAILAALAALASLLAGDHANEGMLSQIEAANQWSYYQAKGIKSGLLNSKVELLKALSQATSKADEDKLGDYAREQKEIREEAEKLENTAKSHLHAHVILSRAVTLFQISIAIAAVSILTKKRAFWGISLVSGAVGIVFLIQGFLTYKG